MAAARPRQADDILGMTRTCFRGFGKQTEFKVDLLLFCVAIYIIDIFNSTNLFLLNTAPVNALTKNRILNC